MPPKRREKLVAGYELRVASYELRYEKLGDFGGRIISQFKRQKCGIPGDVFLTEIYDVFGMQVLKCASYAVDQTA